MPESRIDRICEECEGLIIVPTSDDDDLCVGCVLTSDTNNKNLIGAMSGSPVATPPASKERDPDA